MKIQKVIEAIGRIEPVLTSIERKHRTDLGPFVLDVVNANVEQLGGHLLDKPFLTKELREAWLNGDPGYGPGLGQLLGILAGAQCLPRTLTWLEEMGVDFSLRRLAECPTNPLTSSIYDVQPHDSTDVLKWFHDRHGDDLFRAPVEAGKTVLALALGFDRAEAVVWMLQTDETLIDEPMLSGDPANPLKRSLVDYADVAIQGPSPLRDMLRKMTAARSARLALQEIDADMAGPTP